MNELKEKNERKNQRKTRKENQQQQPRAREEVKASDIESRPSAHVRGITRKDLAEAANIIHMPASEVNEWQHYMRECGWRFKTGACVNWLNFRRSLRMWHKVEEQIRIEDREIGGIRPNAADLAEKQRHDKVDELIRKARTDASLWALCKERCWNANKNGIGCLCGIEIPPDRDPERPIPPEQCYSFLSRKVVQS